MTPEYLEELAIEASGDIANELSRLFLGSLRILPQEVLEEHLLQITNTIWATALSMSISDICRAIRLDREESLRAHDELIGRICDSAKNGYRVMREKEYH